MGAEEEIPFEIMNPTVIKINYRYNIDTSELSGKNKYQVTV
jgi:hypothetical protein